MEKRMRKFFLKKFSREELKALHKYSFDISKGVMGVPFIIFFT